MSKLNCEVIKDLLPLYVEDLASFSSRVIVEEHLVTCKECQKEKAALCTEMQMLQNTDIKAMKNISVKLLQKKVSTICVSVLTMILIFVLIILNINAPIVLPYEKVVESVSVIKNESGELVFEIKDTTLEADIEYMMGEDGVYTADISCYTTKWKQLFEKSSGGNHVVLLSGEQQIQRISYYPTVNDGNIFIYEDTKANDSMSAGYVTLPRLVLHSYMFFAIILSVVGVIVCVCLRKKTNAIFSAIRATLIPITYFLSSLLILTGKGDIYNSMYYFSGILLSTFFMTMIAWWVLSVIQYRKIIFKNTDERNESYSLKGRDFY